MCRSTACLCVAAVSYCLPLIYPQQHRELAEDEKSIVSQMGELRGLADTVRARTTVELAIQIRRLPPRPSKLSLAENLASLSTEGDFEHETLQEVANTLSEAIRESPAAQKGGSGTAYDELAQLVRYEGIKTDLDDPALRAALAKLDANDAVRQKADFTLMDLQGKTWTLQGLHGKVVLVNFWATWCPPCRKEIPDLQALNQTFRDELVVLAITDEDAAKVKPFVATRDVTYPILLDPGRKVHDVFRIEGIPKSFIYDRDGKLVAEAIDMRTRKQFLEMLERAGLR